MSKSVGQRDRLARRSSSSVYIGISRRNPDVDEIRGSAEWVFINQTGKLNYAPEMQYPDHLDLSKTYLYSSSVYINSKIYLMGGVCGDRNYPVHSPKVFSYDFTTRNWQEEPDSLRLARSGSIAVAVDSVIYVFGGKIDNYNTLPCPEEYCEFYDFNCKDKGWQFLSTPLNEHCLLAAVYERGNQILLWICMAGLYSFNYVSKAWSVVDPFCIPAAFPINIGSLQAYQVAVVRDILFSHYFGVIYAYDLKKNELLFTKPLENLQSKRFLQPAYPGQSPPWSSLVHVGKDTLLLLYWDSFSTHGKLHCHRINIKWSGERNIRLLTDDCRFFNTPGLYPEGAVLVPRINIREEIAEKIRLSKVIF